MNKQAKPMSIMTLVKFHNHQSRFSANDTPANNLFQLPLHLLIGAVTAAVTLEGVAEFVSSESTERAGSERVAKLIVIR